MNQSFEPPSLSSCRHDLTLNPEAQAFQEASPTFPSWAALSSVYFFSKRVNLNPVCCSKSSFGGPCKEARAKLTLGVKTCWLVSGCYWGGRRGTGLGVKPPTSAKPSQRLNFPTDNKTKGLHSLNFVAPSISEIWEFSFPHSAKLHENRLYL